MKIKISDYAGTNFDLSINSTLAVTGANAANGTYSLATTTHTINFGSGRPLDHLNEQWKVVENNSSTIRLDHPEANEDEHITFLKNGRIFIQTNRNPMKKQTGAI